jgi:hypothetical protein
MELTLEYAVHYSSFAAAGYSGPYCTVSGSLEDAVTYAQQQVKDRPALRCTIYDHEGFVGAPLADFRGCEFKNKDALSPRFREWAGCILFFTGLIFILVTGEPILRSPGPPGRPVPRGVVQLHITPGGADRSEARPGDPSKKPVFWTLPSLLEYIQFQEPSLRLQAFAGVDAVKKLNCRASPRCLGIFCSRA